MTQHSHEQTAQENHHETARAALFETARERVTEERQRTASERDAFRAFARKLRDIQPQTQTTAGGVPAVQAATGGPDDRLGAVEDAYRSTVMSVSHYTDEYDESYEEHVAGEFNADIATVLTDGPRFESHHRQAVIAGAKSAAQRRDDLLVEINDELASLAENADAVRTIEEEVCDAEDRPFSTLSFGSLEGYFTRMDTLEAKCAEILEERQSTLVRQRRRISLPIDAPDIAIYLYQDLPVNYPIIATLADLLGRIEAVQDDINRAIYRG
jgi:hypothetical protein